ncbi:MAG: serine hydrolase domain-containing protein [Gemmatimonadaceae bacterium]
MTLPRLAIALMIATPLAAQHAPQPVTPDAWYAFTRLFDAASDSDGVVGASVLLVRRGRIVAHHEHGLADRAHGERVTERTLFHYGSITKTLTAIAIMQLRDRGRLALDDKIMRWVPELRQVHDPYGAMDGITIRMLLSHSAGFQNPTWPYGAGKAWEPFEPTTWAQLVAMMPYQELLFKPGSRYSYSNPGFIYLARVIEQISGDPWETYIQKNIFGPLALSRSYFGATPYWMAEDRASNYTIRRDSAGRDATVDNGRDFDPGITIPNGGWNAPLGDLAKYLAFLTSAPAGDTALRRRYDIVLARASLDEMWRGVVPESNAPATTDSVGLSFFISHKGATRIIGHTGSQAGFLSFMYIDPVTSTAVVMAMNTDNQTPRPAERSAYRRILIAAVSLLTADK